MNLENRFQCQPWYIKLWRLRYYLPIPFQALRMYLNAGHDPHMDCTYKFCWSLSKGLAQGEMEWYYTMDEVKQRWAERRAKL
jgi:hypothetical protein